MNLHLSWPADPAPDAADVILGVTAPTQHRPQADPPPPFQIDLPVPLSFRITASRCGFADAWFQLGLALTQLTLNPSELCR
jgi:hypothetical protein